MSFLGHRIT